MIPKYIKFEKCWFDQIVTQSSSASEQNEIFGNLIRSAFGCDVTMQNNVWANVHSELTSSLYKQEIKTNRLRENASKGGKISQANARPNAQANAPIDIYYNNTKYIVNNILLEYIQHISHIISTKSINANVYNRANAQANAQANALKDYEKELCMFDFLVKLVHNTTLAEYAGELTTFVSDIRFALLEYIKMLVITKHYKTDDELRMFIKNLHSTFSVPSKADSYLQKITKYADATLKVNPPKYENKRNTTECVEQQPTDFVSEGIARAGM